MRPASPEGPGPMVRQMVRQPRHSRTAWRNRSGGRFGPKSSAKASPVIAWLGPEMRTASARSPNLHRPAPIQGRAQRGLPVVQRIGSRRAIFGLFPPCPVYRSVPNSPLILPFSGGRKRITLNLAERVGFEPTVQLPVLRFSRPTRSTAPAPLQRNGEAGFPANEGSL